MQNPKDPETAGKCLNCGGELAGAYCPACGQAAGTGRLSVRTMLVGVLEGLIDFDRPLYRTLIGLTLRPGTVIGDYVGGKRRRFANPVKYCLSTSALLIVLTRVRGTIVEAASQTIGADSEAAAPVREFLAQYNEINNVLLPYSHLISLAMVPGLALLLRWFFRSSGRSYADHLAFGCYVFGHVVLLDIAILITDLHHFSMNLVAVLINVVPALYFLWAAVVFNRNRVLPGLLRGVLAYGLFVLVTAGLVVGAVVVKMAVGQG